MKTARPGRVEIRAEARLTWSQCPPHVKLRTIRACGVRIRGNLVTACIVINQFNHFPNVDRHSLRTDARRRDGNRGAKRPVAGSGTVRRGASRDRTGEQRERDGSARPIRPHSSRATFHRLNSIHGSIMATGANFSQLPSQMRRTDESLDRRHAGDIPRDAVGPPKAGAHGLTAARRAPPGSTRRSSSRSPRRVAYRRASSNSSARSRRLISG